MSGTLHKLTAGNGYTYLTRQTAALDASERSKSLSDYYAEKGESPGRWWGTGLDGLSTIAVGDVVTEEQMKALFGEGRHPDADVILAQMIGQGVDAKTALKATRLGREFNQRDAEASVYLQEVARRFVAWNVAQGRRGNEAVPDEVRAAIRSEVGRERFEAEFGRAATGEEELSAYVARNLRPASQVCAGYDLTFTPVKSVSALWATAPIGASETIAAAHQAAVEDALSWLENHVAYTRRGAGGVRVVKTRGLIATMFVHRDSRAGDPNLHTHVAVANKVQAADDGAWLALDGSVLYKAFVAASERYNTALERELSQRLGLEFAPRERHHADEIVTREVVGVDRLLCEEWSSRRRDIEARKAQLVEDFRQAHGRLPSPKEGIALAQRANLETRQAKHEARSLSEQRAAWRQEAARVLGGDAAVEDMVRGALGRHAARTRTLSDEDFERLGEVLLGRLESRRSRFQPAHVIAEAQRIIKDQALAPGAVEASVARLTSTVLDERRTLRLDRVDPVVEPPLLRRVDGRSVYERPFAQMYSTPRILEAERRIVAAASHQGGRKVPVGTVDLALAKSAASGKKLNESQETLVRDLATSGRMVHLSLAPAGSGKTTAMAVLADAWRLNGGDVLGLSPTAVAAAELGASIESRADTLASLTYGIERGEVPEWAHRIDHNTLVLIDEAGMAGTLDLDAAISYIVGRGGNVRLVGDDQQLAAISAGGVLVDIRNTVGASTLTELMRFRDQAEASATLALRTGDPTALGFYFDRERVHATDESDLLTSVYEAWRTDRDAGHETLMLASTRESVNELNAMARAERLSKQEGRRFASVLLASGLEASAGDQIITRQNTRSLRYSGQDFVRNGDRWIVEEVHSDGSLGVVHARTRKSIVLPAAYTARHVDLGYATTVHGAQGATVDTCHVALNGQESRQMLYVAMSRARLGSHAYLAPSGSSDTPEVAPSVVSPETAFDVLARIVARDDSAKSASTFAQTDAAAATVLPRESRIYGDALNVAAVSELDPERRATIAAAAEELCPGLTEEAAWDTLMGTLAVIEIGGGDATASLSAAIQSRELDTALDRAAVLDWRLDGGASQGASTPPLPWLRGIPQALGEHPVWGPYLATRSASTAEQAQRLADEFRTMAEEHLPIWALPLADHRELLADVAVWRAWAQVDERDPALLGPNVAMVRARRHQARLERRIEGVLGQIDRSAGGWLELLGPENQHLKQDPFWRVVSHRLDLAQRAGRDVPAMVAGALESGPLPVEQPAGALWYRLVEDLAPAAQMGVIGQTRLRPVWTDDLLDHLPGEAAGQVMRSPAWPTLVAAVERAAEAYGRDARDIASRLAQSVVVDGELEPGVSRSDVPFLLACRVQRVLDTPDEHLTEVDLHDDEYAEFEAVAAERLNEVLGRELRPIAPAAAEFVPVEHLQEPVHDDELPPDPSGAPTAADQATAAGWTASSTLAGATSTSRERIVELHDQAAAFYANRYAGSGAARYVADRFGEDLSAHDWITIGYAPQGWTSLVDHLRATTDVTDVELVDAGLAQRTKTGDRIIDVFRDRVVIGIRDLDGALVGFTGRAAPGDTEAPKYINTPQTAAFHKGELLLGLAEHAAAFKDGAIPTRVEGAFDAIAVTLAGGGRVVGVAPLGTALTAHQADLLADAGPAGEVWVTTDTDKAGIKAAQSDFWRLAEAGADTRAPFLVDYQNPTVAVKDAAELYRRDGGASLARCLDVDQGVGTPDQPLLAGTLIDRMIGTDSRVADREAPVLVGMARNAANLIAASRPESWPELTQHTASLLGDDEWAQELVAAEVARESVKWRTPEPDRLVEARKRAAVARDRIKAIATANPTARRHSDLLARVEAARAKATGSQPSPPVDELPQQAPPPVQDVPKREGPER